MMLIRCEDDVRAWLKEKTDGDVFWVESRTGSTHGLPDALVPFRGFLTPVELKYGGVRHSGKWIGRWKVSLRPPQRATLRRLAETGTFALLLVGQDDKVFAGTLAMALRGPEVGVEEVWSWADLTRIVHEATRGNVDFA